MGMKRRYLAVLMGIMVATTSVPAMVYAEDSKTETAADAANDESGEADASDETGDESQENVVLGEVKSVSDSEITIAVGTMKEMGQPGGDGQNGGAPDGNGQGGEAPSGQDGEAPEKPEGDGQDAEDSDGADKSQDAESADDGDSADAETNAAQDSENADGQNGGVPDGNGQGGEAPSMLDLTGEEQTITITADTVITKQAGGDNSSFSGVGAAVLATEGTAYVKDGSVTTDAAGGAGLFAYDDGTVYASGTTVETTQDTSGGVHVAGGGTLYGWDLDVETNGESSAAIRSDRGGGTMVLDGGNYVSNGVGSPAIYSTADIAVSNASLTANGSEAVCIEGLNSIHLYDCDLTGNMSDLDQNDNTWTVILYQSMSGDSEVGNSTFQMDGGSLTSENGGVFYTTNTESTITLNNVDINYNDDNEFFLQCTGNTNQRGWGQAGANGADCHFTGISQDMQGDVIWDSISDLDFYLTEGSSLTGAVVDDESYAGEGGEGYCNVYVSADSTWTVTGDSTVSSLENEGTIVDSNGKTVTIQGTDGTVYVQGDSEYTITTGSYSDTADMSGATAIQDQSVYTVEKPDQL